MNTKGLTFAELDDRLNRAIITAIDAYLTFKKWQNVSEHVARVNGREGRAA